MKKSPPAILVIRRDNIGDLLCTTPLVTGLRQRYPEARIDALVNSYNAPVLHGNPDLDHVYAYTKAKHRQAGETVLGVHWRRLRLLLGLRRVGYDLVILAGEGNIQRQMGLARWLRPGRTVGFRPADGKALRGLDLPVPPPAPGHEVERSWSLLTPLGIGGEPPAMTLRADPAATESVRAMLAAQAGYSADRPLLAVHISARKIPQRWPVEAFAALLHQLHREDGWQFMLFWSPGDENNPLHPGDDAKAKRLLAACEGLPVFPCPTQQLSQLIAALDLCSAMVCSDGGAMHIAAALGKPIVCLFGNSDTERWHPWGVPYVLLQKPSRNVADIAPEEVAAALAALPGLPVATA